MSVQPNVESQLDEFLCEHMSLSEAAYRLGVYKRDVALLLWEGLLRHEGAGIVNGNDVLRLVASQPAQENRMKRDPGRLPRITESVLWLLADWGGRGRVTELASALEVAWVTANEPVLKLIDAGLLRRHKRRCHLTEEGWVYVERHRRLL